MINKYKKQLAIIIAVLILAVITVSAAILIDNFKSKEAIAPGTYQQPLEIVWQDYKLNIKPLAAQAALPQASKDNVITYVNAYTNTDVIQTRLTNKLKEDIILKQPGHPLEFEAGSGQVIPGFDRAVLGMKIGEEKVVVIPPKDAYGDHNPELVKKIPRDKIPAEAKVGMMLAMSLPTGVQLPAKITELNTEFALIDINPPLAGKTLHFKLKLVGING